MDTVMVKGRGLRHGLYLRERYSRREQKQVRTEEKVSAILAAHPKAAADVGLCVDGGWSTDLDSTPFCETCGVRLACSLTDYGVDEDLSALTSDCQPSFDNPEGWADLDNAVKNLREDDPRWRHIARVVDEARAAEATHEAHLAHLAVQPGMREARAGLLDALRARMAQQAYQPSFRLWDELQRYQSLPFEATHFPTRETQSLLRRLFREAEAFLALAGWPLTGEWVKTPHGTLRWTSAVELAQESLWRKPAFLEGQGAATSRFPPRRDANPYPKGSAEYRSWDCGYFAARAIPRLQARRREDVRATGDNTPEGGRP